MKRHGGRVLSLSLTWRMAPEAASPTYMGPMSGVGGYGAGAARAKRPVPSSACS
jgi:hypothetical protein